MKIFLLFVITIFLLAYVSSNSSLVDQNSDQSSLVNQLDLLSQTENDLSTAVAEAELAFQKNKKQSKAGFLKSLLGMESKEHHDKNSDSHHQNHSEDHEEEYNDEDTDEKDYESESHHHKHHHNHHYKHHHNHHYKHHHNHHRRHFNSKDSQDINITLQLPNFLSKKLLEAKPAQSIVENKNIVNSVATAAPTLIPLPTATVAAPVVIAPAAVVVAATQTSPSLASHCKAGTFFSDAVKHCFPCPPGKGSLDGATTCVDIALLPTTTPPVSLCGAGTYIKDGFCIPCPEGTTSGDHAKVCMSNKAVKQIEKIVEKKVEKVNTTPKQVNDNKPKQNVVAKKAVVDNKLIAAVAAAIKAVTPTAKPKPARRKNKKHGKKHHKKSHKKHHKKKKHH